MNGLETGGARRTLALLGFITGVYVGTRKKYRLPDFSFFIPNVRIFSGNSQQDYNTVVKMIKNMVDIRFVTKPKVGWLLSFKPISNVVQIPIKLLLPWDSFLAIPQIKEQIGKSIKIQPKKIGGLFVGYKVTAHLHVEVIPENKS